MDQLDLEFTSDAFGILIYETDAPDWRGAARVVLGDSESSVVRITASDGMTSSLVPIESFFAVPHNEESLTISVDWADRYVTASFEHQRMCVTSSETYIFGTLEAFAHQFIDALVNRFRKLGRFDGRVLLGIDPVGTSIEADWHELYAKHRAAWEAALVGAASQWTPDIAADDFNVMERETGYGIWILRK